MRPTHLTLLMLPWVAWWQGNVVLAQSLPSRPSAFAPGDQPNLLLVADSLHGRVIKVSLDQTPVSAEYPIGESLVDLMRLGENRYLASDRQLRQLIAFDLDGDHSRVWLRASLDLEPVRMAISDVNNIACVTSRWSQTVQLVTLSDDVRSRAWPPLMIGFETQEVLPLPQQRFLVADAFAGRLAIINAATNKVESRQAIHGHNLRGLALTNDHSSVLLSHQILSRVARSDVDDIHWGNLMQNVVSEIPLTAFGLPAEAFHRSVKQIQLGDTGRGFADPTGILSQPGGFAVLSGGARQLLIHHNQRPTQRINVGRRPTRIQRLGPNRIAILNEHDGTLSIVSTGTNAKSHTIKLGTPNQIPVSAGEAAFYDANLSHDAWMTCNSCHVDGHTPGLLADTFGDGSFDAAKMIPSLLGAKSTAPYGWLGNKPDLSTQVATTIATTMHGKNPPLAVTKQLVTFLEGLPPPAANTSADEAVVRGGQVFRSQKCSQCHRPTTFTSPIVEAVGLQDEAGNDRFNPPSLRGLRFRRAYFHDGRAATLRDVLTVHRHQLNDELPLADLDALLAYLNSL